MHADAAAVNPNGTKPLLTNSLSTFLIKGNPVFSNGSKSIPKKSPDCPPDSPYFMQFGF